MEFFLSYYRRIIPLPSMISSQIKILKRLYKSAEKKSIAMVWDKIQKVGYLFSGYSGQVNNGYF
jgi:hypothetical protein